MQRDAAELASPLPSMPGLASLRAWGLQHVQKENALPPTGNELRRGMVRGPDQWAAATQGHSVFRHDKKKPS